MRGGTNPIRTYGPKEDPSGPISDETCSPRNTAVPSIAGWIRSHSAPAHPPARRTAASSFKFIGRNGTFDVATCPPSDHAVGGFPSVGIRSEAAPIRSTPLADPSRPHWTGVESPGNPRSAPHTRPPRSLSKPADPATERRLSLSARTTQEGASVAVESWTDGQPPS